MTVKFSTKEDRSILLSGVYGKYLHGRCYAFAIALYEGLSLPLVGIQVGNEIIHAGVKSGDGLYRDVRGDLTFEEFIQGFDISSEFMVRDTSREELEELYAMKVRVSLDRAFIDRARTHAESLWSSWEWKDSKVKKMERFVGDLDALCKKHGIWIREQFPASPSIIYFGDEVEAGYDLKQLPAASLQFLVTRRFHS